MLTKNLCVVKFQNDPFIQRYSQNEDTEEWVVDIMEEEESNGLN